MSHTASTGTSTDTKVSFNAERQQYEIFYRGKLAGFAAAPFIGEATRLFDHTVIFPAFRGAGLAAELVDAALLDVRSKGMKVKATCPLVVAFMGKHPAYDWLKA